MKTLPVVCLLACVSSACDQIVEEKSAPVAESVTLPMNLIYPGTPEIGHMKNVQTVMEWNKRLSGLNFDVAELLADTVSFHLADGMEMTASRDSTIIFLKGYAAGLAKIEIVYVAAIPVNVVEQRHQWVLSWTDETFTLKNGAVDQNYYHEDYRMEGGKIREVFQYARKRSPPAN
jgi:hypothetical protein